MSGSAPSYVRCPDCGSAYPNAECSTCARAQAQREMAGLADADSHPALPPMLSGDLTDAEVLQVARRERAVRTYSEGRWLAEQVVKLRAEKRELKAAVAALTKTKG